MLEESSRNQWVVAFLEEKAGASLYEFALVASLIAVVSIIMLVALNLAT